jgi:hypothetical protein
MGAGITPDDRRPFFISRGQGREKTASFRVRMNRTPCITTKNYESSQTVAAHPRSKLRGMQGAAT